MPYTPILATLGYIVKDDMVLLVNRNKRPSDPHFGKLNGLGGKLEPYENIVSCIKREILEESGLTIYDPVLRGTISWPGFGKNGEDWFGFIYVITDFTGELKPDNDEGHLAWYPLERFIALEYPVWEGDKHFLAAVFDRTQAPFHGVMPYEYGQPVSWTFER
jgi:8-oxo-dGTP diphosphatase